ncbi:YwaF family protein [Mycoplasmatota bacterium]|nr:YwaF family protein [Mycoplasmatota bacterium]
MLLSNFFTTIGMDEQPGKYFFSNYHLIYLLISIFFFILLFKFLKNKSRKRQNTYITFFLILIIILKYAGEALFIYEYYFVEESYSSYPHAFFDINTFFSFQLCGIMNIVLPIVIWFDIKPLKDFVFATSILGGLAVMFYPVTVLYGNPFALTLPILRSTIVHFFLVFIPLFLMHRGDFNLNKKRWYSIAFWLIMTALWAMFGNIFIDSNANNMYLMSNPFKGGPIPIINVLPNGFHVIFLAFAVTIGYVIVYQIAGLFTGKHLLAKHLKQKHL